MAWCGVVKVAPCWLEMNRLALHTQGIGSLLPLGFTRRELRTLHDKIFDVLVVWPLVCDAGGVCWTGEAHNEGLRALCLTVQLFAGVVV